MSNPTYSSHPFQPALAPAAHTLLGELFSATPLAILIAALKVALRQPAKR